MIGPPATGQMDNVVVEPPPVVVESSPAAGSPLRDRLIRLAPSTAPGALMLCVGLIGADRPSLSWDEVTTADVAQRSAGQIWQLINNVDAVFGPYYLFMHAWTSLVGTTEVDLRLPSIVAMAAAVAAAGELGRRLFTPLIGMMAGVVLCIMPNSSRYAAEARPYAFACLLSAVAVLLLMNALERGRPRRWTGYGCTIILLGLSHVIALTTLAAHATMVAFHRRHRGSRRDVAAWVATLVAAGAVLLPVAWLGTHQRDVQLHWVDPLTMGSLYRAPGDIVGSDPTAWLLIGMALLATWRPARRLTEIAVLALAPLTVVAMASILFSPFWVARYLLVVLAPAAILAAVAAVGPAGIPRHREKAQPEMAQPEKAEQARPYRRSGRARWHRPSSLGHLVRTHTMPALRLLSILALLAATAYPGHRTVRGATAKNGPDYRTIAKVIAYHQHPGDGMVYEKQSRALRAGVEYYLRQHPTWPRDVLQRRPAAEAGQLRADEHSDAAAHVAGLDRVWLIVDGQRTDPTTGQPALRPLLRTAYDRIGIWYPKRATVALFRHRAGR
jgi:mannosyltransferase